MLHRGGWTLAGGIFVWYMNRVEYPGPSFNLLIVFTLLAAVFFAAAAQMRSSSQSGKLKLRDKLLDQLALKGDEKVLDAGCGRGLMAIGAAKRLTSGKVTACDIWDANAITGNSGDATRDNAKLEGVADRVRVENCDMKKLTYPGDSFDIVISTAAIHHMQDEPDRDQAVRELYRVTKPGGRIVLFDNANVKRYEEILRECGASTITSQSEGLFWCRPAQTVIATK